jgi:hypothetical protein
VVVFGRHNASEATLLLMQGEIVNSTKRRTKLVKIEMQQIKCDADLG